METLSQQMASACNAMISYRSNPHLDQFQVGRQAAYLLFETLRGNVFYYGDCDATGRHQHSKAGNHG